MGYKRNTSFGSHIVSCVPVPSVYSSSTSPVLLPQLVQRLHQIPTRPRIIGARPIVANLNFFLAWHVLALTVGTLRQRSLEGILEYRSVGIASSRLLKLCQWLSMGLAVTSCALLVLCHLLCLLHIPRSSLLYSWLHLRWHHMHLSGMLELIPLHRHHLPRINSPESLKITASMATTSMHISYRYCLVVLIDTKRVLETVMIPVLKMITWSSLPCFSGHTSTSCVQQVA
jgi:hypothetical protein